MINLFIVSGYLTAEPQQHYTIDGTLYIFFRLGSKRHFRSPKQPADFVTFRANGRMAETFLRYVQVGQCVTVEGSFRSALIQLDKRSIPREDKVITRVYFDKQKSPPEVLDPSQQEIIKYSGFDENGLFPVEDAEDDA